MSLPKIGNYHPGRPNPNCMWVRIGTVKIYYSYDTPIAWDSDGTLYINNSFYSSTTSKHLGFLRRMYSSKHYYPTEQDFMIALDGRLHHDAWLKPEPNSI